MLLIYVGEKALKTYWVRWVLHQQQQHINSINQQYPQLSVFSSSADLPTCTHFAYLARILTSKYAGTSWCSKSTHNVQYCIAGFQQVQPSKSVCVESPRRTWAAAAEQEAEEEFDQSQTPCRYYRYYPLYDPRNQKVLGYSAVSRINRCFCLS